MGWLLADGRVGCVVLALGPRQAKTLLPWRRILVRALRRRGVKSFVVPEKCPPYLWTDWVSVLHDEVFWENAEGHCTFPLGIADADTEDDSGFLGRGLQGWVIPPEEREHGKGYSCRGGPRTYNRERVPVAAGGQAVGDG